jgi:hypothetical protein
MPETIRNIYISGKSKTKTRLIYRTTIVSLAVLLGTVQFNSISNSELNPAAYCGDTFLYVSTCGTHLYVICVSARKFSLVRGSSSCMLHLWPETMYTITAHESAELERLQTDP